MLKKIPSLAAAALFSLMSITTQAETNLTAAWVAESSELTGFKSGSPLKARVVSVLFDPLDAKSMELWEESKKLPQVQFKWIPLNDKNTAQGQQHNYALIESSNPEELMDIQALLMRHGATGYIATTSRYYSFDSLLAKNKAFYAKLGPHELPVLLGHNFTTQKPVVLSGEAQIDSVAEVFGWGIP